MQHNRRTVNLTETLYATGNDTILHIHFEKFYIINPLVSIFKAPIQVTLLILIAPLYL